MKIKTTFLTTLLLTSFTVTFSQNISIADPELKAEIVFWFDDDGDNEISVLEAESVDIIELEYDINDTSTLNDRKINNISGLENFVNIEFLDLTGQNVDLNGIDFSKFNSLTDLYINDNTVSNLDLTNNVVLESLLAANCGLNTINLPLSGSNNKKLIDIDLSDNNLTSIDFSKHKKLEDVNLSNNQLTSVTLGKMNYGNILNFDVSGSADLNCVEVNADYVDAFNNDESASVYQDDHTSFSSNCAALSNKIHTISEFKLFPNPMKNTISVNTTERSSLTVFNSLGKEILSLELEIGKTTINTEGFNRGLYLFNISNNNSSVTKRILKQ